ncbi:cola, partial [Drosophila busckii]
SISWKLRTRLLRLTADRLRLQQRSKYNWSNYDASAGECCKMMDEATARCKNMICGYASRTNKCDSNERAEEKLYSDHLLELLSRGHGKEHCELYKSDLVEYKPSNKNRRYQRTWAECPLIWLRPKQTCCYEREFYPPMERRCKQPEKEPTTAVDAHKFQMDLLCKYYVPMGQSYKKRTRCYTKSPTVCERKCAPFPSFSECDPECIPRFCPTECACKVKPSMCEMWRSYNQNNGIRHCTEAIVGNCIYKQRSRPLY